MVHTKFQQSDVVWNNVNGKMRLHLEVTCNLVDGNRYNIKFIVSSIFRASIAPHIHIHIAHYKFTKRMERCDMFPLPVTNNVNRNNLHGYLCGESMFVYFTQSVISSFLAC